MPRPKNSRFAVRPLRKLYGTTPACEFGPLALKAVREEMIQADICRNEINKRMGRFKRMFAWGVENELIPALVHHGLQAEWHGHSRLSLHESDESAFHWSLAKAGVPGFRLRLRRERSLSTFIRNSRDSRVAHAPRLAFGS
jgi:hypothetical protein